MRRAGAAAIALVALVLVALAIPAPARVLAGDESVHVRVVQIKAVGKREAGKPIELDKDLEPLRAHLETSLEKKARASLIKKETHTGAPGKTLVFELENHHHADAIASFVEDRIEVALTISKRDLKTKKDDLLFTTTVRLKDGATLIQSIVNGAETGDLVLAITASRDSL
jgi:hypothetical protein